MLLQQCTSSAGIFKLRHVLATTVRYPLSQDTATEQEAVLYDVGVAAFVRFARTKSMYRGTTRER